MTTHPRRLGAGGWKRIAPPLALGVFAAITLAATVVALVSRAAAIAVPCESAECAFPRLNADAAAGIESAGMTLQGYAIVCTLLSVIYIAILAGLGLLVALRGRGSSRWPIAAVWFALAFGSVSTYSPWPWATYLITPLGLIGFYWLMALFPTQTLTPRWVIAPATIASLWALVTFGIPPIVDAIAMQQSPWYQVVGPVFIACMLGITAAQVVRFRRASPATRRAQGQLLIALTLTILGGLGGAILAFAPEIGGQGTILGSLGSQLFNLIFAVVLVVIAAAVVRDGLYGVRVVVDNVLFGAVIVAVAAVAYASVAFVVSQVTTGPAATATAGVTSAIVLAALYAPTRRAISGLVYGSQDAASVVTAMGARVAETASATTVVTESLEELCTLMRLPGAELRAGADRFRFGTLDDRRTGVVALSGEPGAGADMSVIVGLRPGQRRLTRRDRQIIAASAGSLASAIAVRRLAQSAEQSRKDVVGARERERGSLRRRLHDGVGPGLAVARHLIDAASTDAADPQGYLAAADRAVADALAQVRAISRELRPPSLDELGWADAITGFAAQLGLRVSLVEGPDVVLHDEQRIALYRIAVEALVNASRHGAASSVDITVQGDDGDLVLMVVDDGIGILADSAQGVGIDTMRERAQELGGVLTVTGGAAGGTAVICRLPLEATPPIAQERAAPGRVPQ